MDNITHSLVGALIGQAGLKRKTGLAMPALIIGANLPDIDATCVLLLGDMQHLAVRRGVTHGPLAWVLLPLLLAGLLWMWDRWQARRGSRPESRLRVSFGWLFALSFLACLTHPALDWLNNYGVRLLEPFSHRWFYGDALYIIDVWLLVGLGLATWLSLRRERRGEGNWTFPARAALAGGLAYILANIGLTAFVADYARMVPPYPVAKAYVASPVPLAPWRRRVIYGAANDWKERDWALFTEFGPVRDVSARPCVWPDAERLRRTRPDLDAFLFWSRMPYAERRNGAVAIRDARFSEPIGGGAFTVLLPESPCLEPDGN